VRLINPRTRASLLGLLAALGCATPHVQENLPLDFYPEGDYQHVITGLTFPTEIGWYKRTRVSRYDTEFYNVSGHYELEGPPWGIATVYHYPAAADGSFPTYSEIYSEFEAAKRDLLLTRESATLISESDSQAMVNGMSLLGHTAAYSLDQPENIDGAMVSTLYLYTVENWFLKFRFTHWEIESPRVVPHEKDFIETIQWPISGGETTENYHENCISLANSYELIARNQDLGMTEEEQLELVGEPGESKEDRFGHAIIVNAISVAKAFPDKTSLQIRSLILDDCTVDEHGRPSLNEFWPWTYEPTN
jgi:hypothetical protein